MSKDAEDVPRETGTGDATSSGPRTDDPPIPQDPPIPPRPRIVGPQVIVDPEVEEVPAPVLIDMEDVGPLSELQTFDMRNGNLSVARSLLVRATIDPVWHWQFIDGLPPESSVKYCSAFIRQAFQRLKLLPIAGATDALTRKRAIVLGVARAVVTELYRIMPNDVIPGERADGTLRAVRRADGSYEIQLKNGLPDASVVSLTTPLAFTPAEKRAIAAVHMSAVGILPLQGYSLVMTNHHYLGDGDNQSKRAYLVVERQLWGSQADNSWWASDEEAMRDLLWHKIGHPVSMDIKRGLALREDIPKMLDAAGAGAAAARLPAEESEVRRAKSYRTLMRTVRPLLETYRGTVDFGIVTSALDAVRCFPVSRPQGAPEMVGQLPMGTPGHVNNRMAALAYLQDVCERNSDHVAFCYGFYCALSEQSQLTGTGGGADTLKGSYSLKSLKNASYASWVAGTQAYGDYAAARAHTRSEGNFIPPELRLA